MKNIIPILILFSSFGTLIAEQIHPNIPVGTFAPKIKKRANLPEQTVKIDGLKAVMLGGEVDGVNGSTTKSYTNYLKRVAEVLRARNVKVLEFYSPTTKEDIEKALKDANFIFYAGHGIGSSNAPSYIATGSNGGMLVLENVWTGSGDIKNWEVKQGAIVFFLGACFTAGNAGTDIGKINAEEAKRRITLYSEPYLNSKFGGYYAAWSDYEVQNIVARLFAGDTLGDAYSDSKKMKDISELSHSKSSGNTIFYRGNSKTLRFDYAFAGKPEKKLTDLFGESSADIKEPDPVKTEEDTPLVYDEKKSMDLIRAIYKGSANLALEALDKSANPNTLYNGWSALLLAVNFNNPEIVAKLIEKKADINAETQGWTPLMLSEELKFDKITELLKSAGATKKRAMFKSKKPRPSRAPR